MIAAGQLKKTAQRLSDMTSFLDMDGYGLYVWLSYALSFAFVIGAAAHTWKRAQAPKKTKTELKGMH